MSSQFLARNDWSSTLSEDNRSYLYNSASLSALLSRFIDPDQNLFNYLKVRGSWAEVGNDTDPYQLIQTFNVPGQGYLGLTTLSAPSVKLNPDLKPEKVTSTEFGLEFAVFDNKLNFDLSIYDITTTDLIYNVPVPAATDFNSFLCSNPLKHRFEALLWPYPCVPRSQPTWTCQGYAQPWLKLQFEHSTICNMQRR